MGYYMRFIIEDQPVPSAEALCAAYEKIEGAKLVEGEICNGEEIFGAVTINTPGDGLFEDEIEEFQEQLGELSFSLGKMRVNKCLKNAKATISVQVLFGTGKTEDTLAKIDPLWAWLFNRRRGLLQADGEGFYDSRKQILETG